MPNFGEKFINLYDSGLVKVPASIRNQIDLVEEKNRYGDVGRVFVDKLEKILVGKKLEKIILI